MLFGDETSFGLAAALQSRPAAGEMVFEVSGAAESCAVLTAIGLGRATVVERRDDDAHLAPCRPWRVLHPDGQGAVDSESEPGAEEASAFAQSVLRRFGGGDDKPSEGGFILPKYEEKS